MAHKSDCPCPACRYRRGEGKGQLPHLSVRISEPIKQAILEAPEGARAYLERLVRDDQSSAERERELRDLRSKVSVLEHLLTQAHLGLESIAQERLDQAEPSGKNLLFEVVIQELPSGLTAPKGWAKLTRVKARTHEEAVPLAMAKLFGKRCQFVAESTDKSGRLIGVAAPLRGIPEGARVSVQCMHYR